MAQNQRHRLPHLLRLGPRPPWPPRQIAPRGATTTSPPTDSPRRFCRNGLGAAHRIRIAPDLLYWHQPGPQSLRPPYAAPKRDEDPPPLVLGRRGIDQQRLAVNSRRRGCRPSCCPPPITIRPNGENLIVGDRRWRPPTARGAGGDQPILLDNQLGAGDSTKWRQNEG